MRNTVMVTWDISLVEERKKMYERRKWGENKLERKKFEFKKVIVKKGKILREKH